MSRVAQAPPAICADIDVRPRENRLLASLPLAEYEALVARCAIVHLDAHTPTQEAGAPLTHVFFPLSGLVSVTTLMADGAMVEVGTIGREGLAGLPAPLRGDQ